MEFELLEETFINEKSKEEIPGITLIIDDDIKRVLDMIIKLNPLYKTYTSIIANALIKGINKTATIYKNDEIVILEEELYNAKDNLKVKGVRVMLDGKLKNLFDTKINSGQYKHYSEVFGNNLKVGLNDIINSCKGLIK